MKIAKTEYSHFISFPFIREMQRQLIRNIQQQFMELLTMYYQPKDILPNNYNLTHLTLSMLSFDPNQAKRGEQSMGKLRQQLQSILKGARITVSSLGYFSRFNYKSKQTEVSVIYLKVEKNSSFDQIIDASNIIIREFLKEGLILEDDLKSLHLIQDQKQKYRSEAYHVTLFRLKNIVEDQTFMHVFSLMNKMLVPLHLQCDFVDISTRFAYDSNSYYKPLSRIIIDHQ